MNFNKISQEELLPDNLYNPEKYSQELQPKNDSEKEIWQQIETADKPIRNVLKRLNRLSLDEFPGDDFTTTDSCSGHVTKNGELEAPHVFFGIKPKYKIIEQDGEEYYDIDDFDKRYSEKFIGFFREIFIKTINKINIKYGQGTMSLGYFDYKKKGEGEFINKEYINKEPILTYNIETKESYYNYNVGYFFDLKNIKDVQILKDFWATVENELSSLDQIKYKTNFTETSFSKDKSD
jgi:hypothetical protein